MQGAYDVEFFAPRFPRRQCHSFAVSTAGCCLSTDQLFRPVTVGMSGPVSSASGLAAACCLRLVELPQIVRSLISPTPAGTARLDQILVVECATSQLMTPSRQ